MTQRLVRAHQLIAHTGSRVSSTPGLLIILPAISFLAHELNDRCVHMPAPKRTGVQSFSRIELCFWVPSVSCKKALVRVVSHSIADIPPLLLRSKASLAASSGFLL